MYHTFVAKTLVPTVIMALSISSQAWISHSTWSFDKWPCGPADWDRGQSKLCTGCPCACIADSALGASLTVCQALYGHLPAASVTGPDHLSRALVQRVSGQNKRLRGRARASGTPDHPNTGICLTAPKKATATPAESLQSSSCKQPAALSLGAGASSSSMSYLLPHLHKGFAVDQAILSVSLHSLSWHSGSDVLLPHITGATMGG